MLMRMRGRRRCFLLGESEALMHDSLRRDRSGPPFRLLVANRRYVDSRVQVW